VPEELTAGIPETTAGTAETVSCHRFTAARGRHVVGVGRRCLDAGRRDSDRVKGGDVQPHGRGDGVLDPEVVRKGESGGVRPGRWRRLRGKGREQLRHRADKHLGLCNLQRVR